MKKKKVGISKIELEINGKKIALSPAEAKELRSILNDLMGDAEKEIRWIPYRTYPLYPYVTWGGTYCEGTGTLTLTNGSTGVGQWNTTDTVTIT